MIPNAADNLAFKKRLPRQDPAERPEQLQIDLAESAPPVQNKSDLAYDRTSGQFYVQESYPKMWIILWTSLGESRRITLIDSQRADFLSRGNHQRNINRIFLWINHL